jgi:endonuclease/exonuclease/phosphatase family metal-dependent hydrolase
VSQHRGRHDRSPLLLVVASLVVTAAMVSGGIAFAEIGADTTRASLGEAVDLSSAPQRGGGERKRPAVQRSPRPRVQPGPVIEKQRGPVLARTSDGRAGTGLSLGPVPALDAPIGTRVAGAVAVAVANLPNRTSSGGFASSLATLTADGPDFVTLNEVSGRSIDAIRAAAPGYDAYRDPSPDRSTGGSQSMNNVVMWRADQWRMIDGGRVKVVDNDTGYLSGHAFVWDRYATWAMLQRASDGAIVSVVSVHMPTNPAKFPRQPGRPAMSRVQRYSLGMDVLVRTVQVLAAHGPVLVGGDMNSHQGQGSWTAAAKMGSAGFGYVKDRGVMHLFYESGVRVLGTRQVGVASDHPGLVATLDMSDQGPR